MSGLPETLLVRDEGLLTVSLVRPASGETIWQVPVPPGRNLILVDGKRWLIGTEQGFELRAIADGAILETCSGYAGNLAVARAGHDNWVLSAIEGDSAPAIVLRRLGRDEKVIQAVVVPGYAYARVVTALPTGGYLVTSNRLVLEVAPDGAVVGHATIRGPSDPHAWQALRLPDGTTLVSCGYAANLQIFDASGGWMRSISAPAEVRPYFFAGLEQLPGGDFLVANWQGHGTDRGHLGHQVLRFDRDLNFAGSWRQDPARFSSIQGIAAVTSPRRSGEPPLLP